MFSNEGAVFIFLWLLGERTVCRQVFCKQMVNIALERGYKPLFLWVEVEDVFSDGADSVNML